MEVKKEKSLITAYILWLIGGWFGLHHLYLRRDRHAFIWWSTLGGFGIGWLTEIFTLPEIVRDVNEDPKFIVKYVEKLKRFNKPPFSMNRFIGQISVGYMWGQLTMLAIPQDHWFDINWSFLHWLIPLAASLGIWCVGNVGRERGKLWHCLLAGYLVYPFRYIVYDETYWFTGIIIVSTLVFDNYSKEWRRTPPVKYSKKRRFLRLSSAVLLYLLLWSSYFYFNGKITDSDGDEVPVYEAISNVLQSPIWADLKQTLSDTWAHAKHNGWYETWRQIVEQMDVDGEQNAYKVLGLYPTASQTEITSAWRTLSKENHPDKVKDEVGKAAAQGRFMDIQQAYEVLSKIKSKRRRKNKQFNDDV